MNIIIRGLTERLPSLLKDPLHFSNHPFARRFRAQVGLSRDEQAISVATNPEVSDLGHCPICARVLHAGVIVSLFARKRTPDNPKTKIPDERTLWVTIDDVPYQLGCLPLPCVDKGMYNKPEVGDRYGIFDNVGFLTRVTDPLVKTDKGFDGDHRWCYVSIPCTQRSS